jgi:hypothetical protein
VKAPRRASRWSAAAAIVLALLVTLAAWRAWRVEPRSRQAVVAPIVATPSIAPALPESAPVRMPTVPSPPEHDASRARADAALLEISQQAERELIRGDALDPQRARMAASSDEFFALLDGFALQAQGDDGKAEIGRLLADQAERGFRRLDSEAAVERLHCGLRLCAARVRAPRSDVDIDLPVPAMRVALPHADGGVDIRIVFAIDPAITGLYQQVPLQ